MLSAWLVSFTVAVAYWLIATPQMGPRGGPDTWRAQIGGAIARPVWETVRAQAMTRSARKIPAGPLGVDRSQWTLHPFDNGTRWSAVVFLGAWLGSLAGFQWMIKQTMQREMLTSYPLACVLALCVVVLGSLTAAGRFAGVPIAMDHFAQFAYWGGGLVLIVLWMFATEVPRSVPRWVRLACLIVLFLPLLLSLSLIVFYYRASLDLFGADSFDHTRLPPGP